jgi:hypothetical protein
MIVAMAMAEWADKDPGDLIAWILPKRLAPVPAAPVAAEKKNGETSPLPKKLAVKTAKVRNVRVAPSQKNSKSKTTVKRKVK